MIKLIFTDLDGTFLNSQSRVSDDNLACLQELKERDIEVILCSGRTQGMIRPFCLDLPVRKEAVSCNGGLIVDFANDRLLSSAIIDFSTVERFMNFGEERLLDFLAYREDGSVFYLPHSKRILGFRAFNEEQKRRLRREIPLFDFPTNFNLAAQSKICKLLAVYYDKAQDREICEFLNTFPDLHYAKSWDGLTDIMKKGATKGTGVRFICSHLNVDIKDVAVIGDNHNDISMFREVECSVCMNNGDEVAKKSATHVTQRDNDTGGWREAINYILNFHNN